MSFSLVFKPAARIEFEEAIAWYEEQRKGLGREFSMEAAAALELAQTNPVIFRRVRGRARKIRLRRFSNYSIYFAVKGDVLSVMSVFHGARDPAELRKRLK
jgi:toxin ParE1/3/4